MHGLQALSLLALATAYNAFGYGSPTPTAQTQEAGIQPVKDTVNNTGNTVTPFYFGEEAAYRWMGPSRNFLTTAQFSQRMDECSLRLIEEKPMEKSMASFYPGGKYSCSLDNSNEYFSMHDTDRKNPWLTYTRILQAMTDLVKPANSFQGRRVYYNLFELWTPPDNPAVKTIQGVWLQKEPRALGEANETLYASS